jgi:hypothetical protein
MKLICVGDEPGFTIGKEYDYSTIKEEWREKLILIKNDFGDLIKHKLNEFIITMLPPSNIWVEYVDDSKDGLTSGKYYNLLDRNKASRGDEHYYFLDDNNKFVGAWRGNRFRDVSKIKLREDRLNELGI